MKIKKFAGIGLVMVLVASGCDQGDSGEKESSDYKQTPQEKVEKMPDQSGQDKDLFGQSESTEVSDEELKVFAVAVTKVQKVRQEIQQEMIDVIEEKGMDVQRFSMIQQAQQNPKQEAKPTAEEMEKLNSITPQIDKIQKQAQQKMEEKIAEVGISVPRFQEIAMTMEKDPALQKKFQMIQQQNN